VWTCQNNNNNKPYFQEIAPSTETTYNKTKVINLNSHADMSNNNNNNNPGKVIKGKNKSGFRVYGSFSISFPSVGHTQKQGCLLHCIEES
jgi:hypothetical protein